MSRSSSSSAVAPAPLLVSQCSFTLPTYPRGCHLVTREVAKHLAPHLAWCDRGTVHLFLQHTSASLTVNENCDSDVRKDMESWMNSAVPESFKWKHDAEGASVNSSLWAAATGSLRQQARFTHTRHALLAFPSCFSDDMPAHVKSSLFGCSVILPVTNGSLNLGTWQGVWLGEHRDDGGARKIVVSTH